MRLFVDNSWYFRNALVRSNYNNYGKNVFEDISFLEKLFYNLLTNTKYGLKNSAYKEEIEKIYSDANNQSLEEKVILNIIKNNPKVKQ